MTEDINWRNIINDIDIDLPSDGIDASTLESIPKNVPELEDVGDFSKLTTEVYFFVDKKTKKTYTMQKHWMTEYGEVPLRMVLLSLKKKKS